MTRFTHTKSKNEEKMQRKKSRWKTILSFHEGGSWWASCGKPGGGGESGRIGVESWKIGVESWGTRGGRGGESE